MFSSFPYKSSSDEKQYDYLLILQVCVSIIIANTDALVELFLVLL